MIVQSTSEYCSIPYCSIPYQYHLECEMLIISYFPYSVFLNTVRFPMLMASGKNKLCAM